MLWWRSTRTPQRKSSDIIQGNTWSMPLPGGEGTHTLLAICNGPLTIHHLSFGPFSLTYPPSSLILSYSLSLSLCRSRSRSLSRSLSLHIVALCVVTTVNQQHLLVKVITLLLPLYPENDKISINMPSLSNGWNRDAHEPHSNPAAKWGGSHHPQHAKQPVLLSFNSVNHRHIWKTEARGKNERSDVGVYLVCILCIVL